MPPSGKLTAAQIADLTKTQIAELQKALPNYDIISNALAILMHVQNSVASVLEQAWREA